MRTMTVVVLALLAAGCASEQEIAARDSARCESFGFKPDTEAFAQCRLELYKARYGRLDSFRYSAGYRAPYYHHP